MNVMDALEEVEMERGGIVAAIFITPTGWRSWVALDVRAGFVLDGLIQATSDLAKSSCEGSA